MKVYRTFDEIDRDLKILKLRSNIEKEEIKSCFSDIKEELSPVSVAANFVGAVAKKALLYKTVASIFRLGK